MTVNKIRTDAVEVYMLTVISC